VCLAGVKSLYSKKDYRGAIKAGEDVLPLTNNPRLVAEVHLLLAKCYKSLGDLKTCITCCNSAIEQNDKWREPFLYRSASFQALHTAYLETHGDTLENIEKDRTDADIIVDPTCTPTDNTVSKEEAAKRRLLRRENKKQQIFVKELDEALRLAENNQKIFIEAGEYRVSAGASSSLSSFFLFGKNLVITGASTKDCVLLYKKSEVEEEATRPKLETFLICASSGNPTIIKRLTFRNGNPSYVKTKFFGVGGGRVQIEDCLFDGVLSSEVDAVYANSAICGNLASSYPAPHVSLVFCVFDHCQSYGTATFSHSCGDIRSCYFTSAGRSSITATDSSKVTVTNCEFGQTEVTEVTVSCTGSDLTVSGCYLQGLEIGTAGVDSQGIGATLKSVARVDNNYLYKTGTGIAATHSDISCNRNLIYSCSRRYTKSENTSTLGLFSAISIRGQGKVQLVDNLAKHCDVGFYITEGAMAMVKGNVIDSSFYAGIFCEGEARPNIVNNTFSGGDAASPVQVPRGLGILFILSAKGMVGKNQFEDFTVSPIMVFTRCHPMLKQNSFVNIKICQDRQASLEESLVKQFHSELQEDSLFYLVDSQQKEEALWEIILKGEQEGK